MNNTEKKIKGGNEKYFLLTKWVIFGCFLLREVVIFAERIFVSRMEKNHRFFKAIETNPYYNLGYSLLKSSLNGRFLNRFMIYYCCQYYIYFKSLKKKIRNIEAYSSLNSLPKRSKYERSHFKRTFMMLMPKIMDKIIYYDEEKNTITRIQLIKKYFAKHKWIKKFKRALEMKKKEETGPQKKKQKKKKSLLNKILKKLGSSFLSLLSENISFAFRFWIIYVSYRFCSDSQDLRLYMFSFKPYDLSLLLWSLFSFIMPATQDTEMFMLRFGLNVSYPMFLLGMFSRIFIIFYRKDKHLELDTARMELLKNNRLGAFFLLLGYTLIQLLKGNKSAMDTKVAKWYNKKKENIKSNKNSIVDILVEEVIKMIIKFSRIIALIAAVYASLQAINLWNTMLLFFTLVFFWSSKRDQTLWPKFLYFNILILLQLFVSQLIPLNIPHFNQEITTMLGAARITPKDYRN